VIKACLITANHQNPSGHSLKVEQKQWLAEFAAQFEIPIIEDDVFGELTHQGPMPLPIKAWDTQGWVIWCSAISKTSAPGLRLGWCQPGRFLTAMVKQRYLRSFGINQPLQAGLAEFINSGQYAKHIKQVKRRLQQNVLDYHQCLTANLPPNATVSNPSGGLVMWIRVPGLDSQKLVTAAAEHDISLRPGTVFSSRNLYPDHFRINIGWPLDVQLKKQLVLLCRLVVGLV
jgi:DNA-binding transcriptional MocR family regulator